jgi:hypothetical protein
MSAPQDPPSRSLSVHRAPGPDGVPRDDLGERTEAIAARTAELARQLRPILPSPEHVRKRLDQIIRRGSAHVGAAAEFDRLMVMLTRSCDLRCAYCQVGLTEEGWSEPHAGVADPVTFLAEPQNPRGDLAHATFRKAIDMLMGSTRPQLGMQMFGGEPTRNWEVMRDGLWYAWEHPERRGRPMEILFTTNGVNLTWERLTELKGLPVTVQFSLDGDEKGSRFRRGHLLPHDQAVARMMAAVALLGRSGLRWFMNSTLPPAAAGEVVTRYQWAREAGVPALQINYATGLRWSEAQVETWLTGLQEMLLHHARDPGDLELFNWRNDADPVPLCGDIVVDVDGQLYQVGALFHEKRFPSLKHVYRRGHVDDGLAFTGLRYSLAKLWERTQEGLADPDDVATFEGNMMLGAATDLVVQFTRKRLLLNGPPRRPVRQLEQG